MSGKAAQTVALVVAAGRGLRAGTAIPKQYAPLLGRPLLAHTLTALISHPRIHAVVTLIHPDDQALYDAATAGLNLPPPVFGGLTRQESVLKGLETLGNQGYRRVLIHDAARPFVSPALVDRLLDRLDTADGVVPAISVVDSLKRVDGDFVSGSVPREGLFRVQTPQAFRFDKILAAHRAAAGRNMTDDAAVMEASAGTVAVVDGDEDNFKVTKPGDFARAEAQLLGRHADVRSGLGFDVHRFDEGNTVTLCGVEIPHQRALAGHSDADVALHALTDAILGALGAGDIGDHFPPTDDKWKGASSELFVRAARDRVVAVGGLVAHVDITIICEVPRIGPHKQAMREAVAAMLAVSPNRVSIKATTTEKLGFTGRQEGIAAQAIATIRLPERGYQT
ncbi:MAG: bifunctional 2-C-methyl-D-erythritol 4-phosphate cytidylyltransferase/2-C-methyl-D-erythritol 2,4-cyclodiphosphate synthase [Alphaproteobacteria bacterium]|nr:MAG: bifunctional 2-C-methyl-D-erythritol 4-phosphate cytidylyltransferase/2-C-methyl-D-erythritol 2,4-cyclodiphosphate synthase [Alphaproteobacteria bacterium]